MKKNVIYLKFGYFQAMNNLTLKLQIFLIVIFIAKIKHQQMLLLCRFIKI